MGRYPSAKSWQKTNKTLDSVAVEEYMFRV